MTDLTPEAEALGGDGSRPTGGNAATDATPPAASTSPPRSDEPCTCPPWHPGTDGPAEDCAQHGRPYGYWAEYAGVLEGRISALLWDLTGGLLSKPGYDVPTMVQAVEDHLSEALDRDDRERAERAEARIEAVRALHYALPGSDCWPDTCDCCPDRCRECGCKWPCLTIEALDGSDATPPERPAKAPLTASEPETDHRPAPGPSAAFLATSNETAAPVGPSGDVPSLLARAQEWLGCGPLADHNCWPRLPEPCAEAESLAALLAEVEASAWDEGAMHGEVCEGALRCPGNPYRTGADQ